MKILLHMCCAPCSIYPIEHLKENKFHVMGFFYRHNIHPYQECLKRENAVKEYSNIEEMKVIYQEGYELESFLRRAAFREEKRCLSCYYDRLLSTANYAKKGKFDYFTSSLLYSKSQKHDDIKSIGESIGKKTGIMFYYHDFREGWKHGINKSKELNLYRQSYCGCIYSEKDRYFKG